MKLLEGKIRRIIRSKYFHGRCASENVQKEIKIFELPIHFIEDTSIRYEYS